jgi:hypothetical protein
MNYYNALTQEFKRLQKAGVSHASIQRSNQRSDTTTTTTTNQYAANSTSSSANQQWAWSSGQRSNVQQDEVASVQHDEVVVGDGTTLQGRRHIEALIDSMGRDDSSAKGKVPCSVLYTFLFFLNSSVVVDQHHKFARRA